MNTMPQSFDAEPFGGADFQPSSTPRAGFSVSSPAPARRVPSAHLKLVTPPAGTAAVAPPVPYDLSTRRHLARVPERDLPAAQAPQADAVRADNSVSARQGTRAALEPIVFALVLLVSVAALAVSLRAG